MQGEELTFNYGDPETGVKKCIDVEFVDVANVNEEGDTQTVADDDVKVFGDMRDQWWNTASVNIIFENKI